MGGMATRLRAMALAAVTGWFSWAMGGCASLPDTMPSAPVVPPPVSIERISVTAAGHFVDLRYRVQDVDRARAAFTPKTIHRLVDERSGQVMLVPTTEKLGALRQTRGLKTGHTYFMLFVNGGLRPGSLVTAEIGGFRFEHITVQ